MSDRRMQEAMDAVAQIVESHGVAQRGGRKYVQVVHRVEALRKAYGDSVTINTEIIVDDGQRVLMAATVSLDDKRVIGTGYAEEIRGAGPVNKTSAIENCETSAIGRALAACGLAGGEYASANEMAGVERKTAALASHKDGQPIFPKKDPVAPAADPEPPVAPKAPQTTAKEAQIKKYEDTKAWSKTAKPSQALKAFNKLGQGVFSGPQEVELAVRLLTRAQSWDAAQAQLDAVAGTRRMRKDLHAELTLALADEKRKVDTNQQADEVFGGETLVDPVDLPGDDESKQVG